MHGGQISAVEVNLYGFLLETKPDFLFYKKRTCKVTAYCNQRKYRNLKAHKTVSQSDP